MSLIKSFNLNFLKENIKKSKGIIIFSLIIIPIITSLMLYSVGSNGDSESVGSMQFALIIDIVFMYIIPIIYSFVLFGFTFKKKSTDFICSMPLSRKTIFVTNTIGGIVLITIAQILALITILLFSLIFKNIVIIGAFLLENFLLIWLSYIFVFLATNLAMSFSGTFMTQIVSTVLILFLLPVCFELFKVSSKIHNSEYLYNRYYSYSDRYYDYYDLEIFDGEDSIKVETLDKVTNYTIPFRVIRFAENSLFSYETIIKMIVLSVIYFVLGLRLFIKRHMEDNEQSFGNEKFHVLLKGLTLVPMMLLLNLNQIGFFSSFANVVALTMMAIYYFIFDYIVKRKIKFSKTVTYFILSVVIIEFGIAGLNTIITNKDKKEIDLSDIEAISIGADNNTVRRYYGYNNSSYLKFLDGSYYIKDDKLIQLFFDSMNDKKDDYYYDDTLIDIDSSEDGDSKDNIDIYESNYDYWNSMIFNIKLKNGKKYSIEGYIKNKYYKEIVDLLINDTGYSEKIVNDIIKAPGKFEENGSFFENSIQSKINKELKLAIDNIELKDIINENKYFITKYAYIDHKIVMYNIPINVSDKLLQIVANERNKETKKANMNRKIYDITGISIYDENGLVKQSRDYYDYNNNDISDSEVIDFINEHIDEKFDAKESYYIIRMSFRNRNYHYFNITFFTNNVSDLEKIIDK